MAGLLVEALAPYLVLPMGERTSFVGLLEVFLVGVVAFFAEHSLFSDKTFLRKAFQLACLFPPLQGSITLNTFTRSGS